MIQLFYEWKIVLTKYKILILRHIQFLELKDKFKNYKN